MNLADQCRHAELHDKYLRMMGIGDTMTLKEQIAVMQAALDGKKIQYRDEEGCKWIDCDKPSWNWGSCDYRVQPEPKSSAFPVERPVIESS